MPNGEVISLSRLKEQVNVTKEQVNMSILIMNEYLKRKHAAALELQASAFSDYFSGSIFATPSMSTNKQLHLTAPPSHSLIILKTKA